MKPGFLQGAHSFVVKDSRLVDKSTNVEVNLDTTRGSGLKILLDASMPDAFHDSSARYPPPRCHHGTRQNYIVKITDWGLDTSSKAEGILWMWGPAGAGKSAVAQSCTEILAKQNKLGAGVFFSRVNAWDEPNALFTSIAYQLTTKFISYQKIIDRRIQNDSTLVKKSMVQQFQELLVKPLQELHERGEKIEEKVIVIDGLDECAGGNAQCDIVEIVAASVRDATTPFRWAFFSRPETNIVGSFTSDRVRPLSLHLELPVSREIDYEILCYLMDELRKVQEQHGLQAPWPSEEELQILVDLAAGLFIYAATVIRFIGERNSDGPTDQLKAVLSLATRIKQKANSTHPLAELDLFYMLIMQRVPSRILLTIQKILLLNNRESTPRVVIGIANILCLTEAQFMNACSPLSSVLQVEVMAKLKFHHSSFMEFITDPERSGEFCFYSCLDVVRSELLTGLNDIYSRSKDGTIRTEITWPHPTVTKQQIFVHSVETLFGLCQSAHPLNLSTATAMLNFQFRMLPELFMTRHTVHTVFDPGELREKLPIKFRHKLVRESRNPLLYLKRPNFVPTTSRSYVLGYGRNKIICWKVSPVIGEHLWMFYPYTCIF